MPIISPALAAGDRNGFHISGSIRTRYERIDGQARPGLDRDEDIIAIRTLIQAEHVTGDWRIGGELQDSRVYGSEANTSVTANDVNAVEMVQAYVGRRFDAPFGAGTRIDAMIGRMTIALGSRRLVAADEYRNTTQGSTGLRVDFALPGKIDGTAIYVLPQRRLPDDPDDVRNNRVAVDREGFATQFFGGIVAKRDAVGRAMAEANGFVLLERDTLRRATRNRRLRTASARLFAAPKAGHVDFEMEAIYQWGTTRAGLSASAARQNVSAGFVHFDVGYLFPGPMRARLSLEYDRASGDGHGSGNGRFDTLFGMRRADLAPAGLYAQIGRANISTPGIRLEAAPHTGLDFFLGYRAMWLAERTDSFSTTGVRDPTGRAGRFAGHQAEGRIRWTIVPRRLNSEINAALLAKGRFLREAPNAPPGKSVRYASVALTASF